MTKIVRKGEQLALPHTRVGAGGNARSHRTHSAHLVTEANLKSGESTTSKKAKAILFDPQVSANHTSLLRRRTAMPAP